MHMHQPPEPEIWDLQFCLCLLGVLLASVIFIGSGAEIFSKVMWGVWL